MKPRPIVLLVLMTLLSVLPALGTPSAVAASSPLAELPASLAQWYKPQNKRQVWLHTMFSLRREMQAVEEYAEQGEAKLAEKWNHRFVKHLRAIPEMVPEWDDAIEWDEVERLKQALRAANLPRVIDSLDKIRRDCRSCHREYQVLAALRYRSPDFSAVTVDTNQAVGKLAFAEHMEQLSRTLNRIKIASEDDRWHSATDSATQLRSQLEQLASTCSDCHRESVARQRILGDESQALLDALDRALTQQSLRDMGRKLGETAVNICARCHAIHRTISETKRLLFD